MNKQLLALTAPVLTLLVGTALGQNLDLTPERWSGRLRAMGGAGTALAAGVAAFDINPAGLGNLDAVSIAMGHEVEFHHYSLLRENVGNWGFVDSWSAIRFVPEYVTAVFPVRDNLGIGIGYGSTVLPFVDNDRRAITGSSLFHQRTDGSINALSLAAGFNLADGFQVGATVSRHSGTVTSRLQGDNHGRDADQWATLESSVDGFGVHCGLLLRSSAFSVGGGITLPTSLTITIAKAISPNRSYESLFPPYNETSWRLPLSVTFGAAYSPDSLWIFVVDIEVRSYRPSSVQWDMYEVGGTPSWKDAVLVRAGTEFHPFSPAAFPVRLGYAYIPQLYESIDAKSVAYQVTSYTKTGRIVKHLFTAGSSFSFSMLDVAVSLEYSVLTWHRDLHDITTVLDDYTENRVGAFLEVVYRLK